MEDIDERAFARARVTRQHDDVLARGLTRGRLAHVDAVHENLEVLLRIHLGVRVGQFDLNQLPRLTIGFFGLKLGLRVFGLRKFGDHLLKRRIGG